MVESAAGAEDLGVETFTSLIVTSRVEATRLPRVGDHGALPQHEKVLEDQSTDFRGQH